MASTQYHHRIQKIIRPSKTPVIQIYKNLFFQFINKNIFRRLSRIPLQRDIKNLDYFLPLLKDQSIKLTMFASRFLALILYTTFLQRIINVKKPKKKKHRFENFHPASSENLKNLKINFFFKFINISKWHQDILKNKTQLLNVWF